MSKNTNDRNYGYGASGEIKAPKQKGISLRAKLRYRFDNSITKGQGAFVMWLAILGLAVSFVISIVRVILEPRDKGSVASAFKDLYWGTSNTVIFDGKIPSGVFTSKIVSILIWVASVSVAATIIAFITNKLRERVDQLRKGKSPIIESGHTLILGWSNRAFPIIQQLVVANENKRGSVVAIFADVDREVIEDQIAARVPDLGKTRVVIRNGDPTNPKELARTNISSASSVIVLDSNTAGDASIISTVLSIKSVDPDSKISIVAEMDNRIHADALSQATEGRVLAVQSNEIIARVTAQASRQPGLAAVILDLLDFEGDEIYFQSVPQLAGKKYATALISFESASVIGIRSADGTIFINPPADKKIAAGDQLIAIARDDDQVIYTDKFTDLASYKPARAAGARLSRKAEHLLVIGWSHMGTAVMNELAPFLPKGSSIHIVANPALFNTATLPKKSIRGISTKYTPHSGSIDELTKVAKSKKFNEVIVLAYRENISLEEADSQTMLTMLLMNKLFVEKGNGVEPTRLVAEILDSRKADLARVAAVDDLVVSDNLAALMIAQVSQNPELAPVFADIFDADGASINVRPIENYVTLGKPFTYARIAAAAAARGESAIGYHKANYAKGDPTAGVSLNPAKTTIYDTKPGDGLVVISDLG